MIALIRNESNPAAFNLVLGALCRSFSSSMVVAKNASDNLDDYPVIVFVCVDEEIKINTHGKKIIIFGALPRFFKEKYNIENVSGFNFFDIEAQEAETYRYSASGAKVEFLPRSEKEFNYAFAKPTQRYDFMGEWNNLDYGFIDSKQSDWGLASSCLCSIDSSIALVSDSMGNKISYISLLESESGSIFWVNRNVGLCDAHEWILLENFVSDYRSNNLSCLPVLKDIPWGYDAAITMRLDCDEDVTSAEYLYEAYKLENVPLSLALHTSILESGAHDEFVSRFIMEDGAILSHSHTHSPQWGGDYKSSKFEAQTSKSIIKQRFGVDVEFAVTPFHHAPRFALEALKDSGYKGCVGGIVMNDPEFVYARGGEVEGLEAFVGHTQQVMLHGDCVLDGEDPIMVYKESFDRSYLAQSFFGYLDHPFSERYTYGWVDEEQRLNTHLKFIRYMKQKSETPLFTDQINALKFMYDKSRVTFVKTESGYKGIVDGLTSPQCLLPCFRYKGQDIKVEL